MTPDLKALKGISFLFVIGKPAWPKLQISYGIYRIVIGPFALWILTVDMDAWLVKISHDGFKNDN